MFRSTFTFLLHPYIPFLESDYITSHTPFLLFPSSITWVFSIYYNHHSLLSTWIFLPSIMSPHLVSSFQSSVHPCFASCMCSYHTYLRICASFRCLCNSLCSFACELQQRVPLRVDLRHVSLLVWILRDFTIILFISNVSVYINGNYFTLHLDCLFYLLSWIHFFFPADINQNRGSHSKDW